MIEFKKQSGIYRLQTEQTLSAPIDIVWDYFSQPKNLNELTPKNMAFEITSDKLSRMYSGQIITYKIEIAPGIKQNWITEITQVKNEQLFVDEQRFGPYSMWHHEHHFKPISEGNVLMTDIVHYKLPFGFLGNILAGRIIRNRIRQIFQFRQEKITEIFGSMDLKA